MWHTQRKKNVFLEILASREVWCFIQMLQRQKKTGINMIHLSIEPRITDNHKSNPMLVTGFSLISRVDD